LRFLFWGLLFVLSSSYCSPALEAVPAGPGGDEGALTLSLDDAVKRALDSSINIKKNLIDLSEREYSAKNLWSEIFPAINASGGANYGTNLFTGDGFKAEEKNLGYSVSLGLELSLNAGLPAQMKNIRLAYQTQLLKYEDARKQLEISVAKSFYGLIAEMEDLLLLEEMLKLAEQQLERNRVAFANGLIAERVYLQSQLGVETAKYNLSTARADYANGMGVFLTVLGLGQDAVPRMMPPGAGASAQGEAAFAGVKLEGHFDIARIEEDPEALIKEYLFKRPDIIEQRQTIERLENAERQAILSSRAPTVNLSTTWSLGPPAQGLVSDDPSDTIRGSVTVRIPIDPWIPGTGKSQSIRAAGTEADKARLDLKDKEDAAAAQIRSLTATLRNSWDSLEIARLRVKIAERGYQLTEQGFRSGTVESLVLEEARNDLGSARYQLLRGELAYQTTALDLAAALNVDWKTVMRSDR
jgi:outer membrane protein TolC